MRKIFTIFFAILALVTLSSCQTVSKKIDEKVAKEEKELSLWLNQPETELKIVFGKPNKIELLNGGSRYYVYISEKLKIKCERKFEIGPDNMVKGFSTKNCF